MKSGESIYGCLEKLKLNWQKEGNLACLWQDWPNLVGDQLASNCTPLSLKRGILLIGASQPQWRQALFYTRNQLLASFKAAGHQIKDLKIQQYYPEKLTPIESEEQIWSKHPSRIDIHGIETCNCCSSPAPKGELSRWNKCVFCRRKELSTIK